MSRKPSSLLLAAMLAALVSRGASPVSPQDGKSDAPARGVPPPRAAAQMTQGDGTCLRFLSVFGPARGGHDVVGVSFGYRDLNGDGAYTPGVDRMEVCVNCADACGFLP